MNGTLSYHRNSWYHGEEATFLKERFFKENLTINLAASLMRNHLRRMKCNPDKLQLVNRKNIVSEAKRRPLYPRVSTRAWIQKPTPFNEMEFKVIVDKIREGL